MLQGKFFFALLSQMLALHLSVVPAWPFSSSTPTPTSATSALEASCKEHTERYHKYEWVGDCPEPRQAAGWGAFSLARIFR